MGNQKSQFQERFSNNYGFVQALQDPIYGFVRIYRKKFQNYHYVMVIDRRLQQFNSHMFMSECIKPQGHRRDVDLQPNSQLDRTPQLFTTQSSMQQDSMKLQKLKRTFQLIKRYQDQIMVPLFSYQIVNGSQLKCRQPIVQLYVEYHNHRLVQYLQVLRAKSLYLKLTEIVYVLRSLCMGIAQLQRMQIEVTYKQIGLHNIFTSNEGEVKLNPIQILTRRQHQLEDLENIQNIKSQWSTNPSIQGKMIGSNGKYVRSERSSVNGKTTKGGESNQAKNKQFLFSSNQSFNDSSLHKLADYKQILRKLLIQLSTYSLSNHQQNKQLITLNTMITKSPSLCQIEKNLESYQKPLLQGLLIERIYELQQEANTKNVDAQGKQNITTSSMSIQDSQKARIAPGSNYQKNINELHSKINNNSKNMNNINPSFVNQQNMIQRVKPAYNYYREDHNPNKLYSNPINPSQVRQQMSHKQGISSHSMSRNKPRIADCRQSNVSKINPNQYGQQQVFRVSNLSQIPNSINHSSYGQRLDNKNFHSISQSTAKLNKVNGALYQPIANLNLNLNPNNNNIRSFVAENYQNLNVLHNNIKRPSVIVHGISRQN